MRRLLPWFLMLLLALRGLTGVAMAAEAAPEALRQSAQTIQVAQALASASHSAHSAHSADAHPATADSAIHSAAAVACPTGSGDGCSAHTNSPACSACDICHTALLVTPVASRLNGPTGSPVQAAAATPFASALAAQAIKPPIG